MDDRWFIRGVLLIPLVDRNDEFGWGVWAEVERPVFDRYYLKSLDADGSQEPMYSGVLANTIPGYEDAANERVSINFGQGEQRPTLVTGTDSFSSLALHQRTGLDERGHHAMLVAAGAL